MGQVINLKDLLILINAIWVAEEVENKELVQKKVDELVEVKTVYWQGINFECWKDSLTPVILLLSEAGEERGIGLFRGDENIPRWRYIGDGAEFDNLEEALTAYLKDTKAILSRKIGHFNMLQAKVKEALE